jgi:alpha-tubulin suppressor-like RCC1 family protein
VVKATFVTMGAGFGCVVGDDSNVYCWGENDHGELGHAVDAGLGDSCCGIDCGYSPYPQCLSAVTQAMGITGAVAVAAGTEHVCALKTDKTVWCWGANAKGQLGDGTTDDTSTPVAVRGLGDVAGIALGDQHSCAFKNDGTAWCWGLNDKGQLGNGSINSPVPLQVQGL